METLLLLRGRVSFEIWFSLNLGVQISTQTILAIHTVLVSFLLGFFGYVCVCAVWCVVCGAPLPQGRPTGHQPFEPNLLFGGEPLN